QRRRVIGRTARHFGSDPAEPVLGKLKLVDKDVDHANRIVFANPVFQAFRKERGLLAIRALNEASHRSPRKSRANHIADLAAILIKQSVFTQPGSSAERLRLSISFPVFRREWNPQCASERIVPTR